MLRKKFFKNRSGIRWTLLIGVLAFSLLLSSCGEKKPRVYRVGILTCLAAFASVAGGFMSEMAELGYINGENIVYDFQTVTCDQVELKRVVQRFVADKVDLIFTFPSGPALAVKKSSKGNNIPVVFAYATLERSSLVNNVRQPGGNITGVRILGPELAVKRFELLLEMVPHVKRVYIPYNPDYPTTIPALELMRPVASSEGVKLLEVPVTTVEAIQDDLSARTKSAEIGIDAIQLLPEIFTQSSAAWAILHKFAEEHKLPIVGSSHSTADRGALFSYAPFRRDSGRLAAPLADKILKGTPAGTIPVVTLEARLRINYIVARKLGLKIPEGLLSLASEIIR